MGDTPPLSAEDRKRRTTRVKFLNREAAEVYLLLDFLSGRADRSLDPTTDEQARMLLQDRMLKSAPDTSALLSQEERKTRDSMENRRARIEADLQNPTQLVLRTMQIKYPMREGDEHFEDDAAFLMRARDALNSRAAPATGATIAFTSMLAGPRQRRNEPVDEGVTTSEFAESAYPWLTGDADDLGRWFRRSLCWMWVLLILTLIVSAYTAWGKVQLDTLDAIRRDESATQQTLLARMTPDGGRDTDSAAAAPPVRYTCDPARSSNATVATVCDRFKDIRLRNEITHHQIAGWEFPLRWVDPSADDGTGEQPAGERKKSEQWATAAVTVLGNYIMPIFYAFLGSIAFVLRRFQDRLGAYLLTPRDRRANHIRLLLGTLIGGCIGLVYSGSSAAQTTGILGMAVTLSTSAMAFFAGYGVEGVFWALDGLITQVFRVNATDRTPTRPST